MAPIKLKELNHHQYLSLYTVNDFLRCIQYTKHRLINCPSIIVIIIIINYIRSQNFHDLELDLQIRSDVN